MPEYGDLALLSFSELQAALLTHAVCISFWRAEGRRWFSLDPYAPVRPGPSGHILLPSAVASHRLDMLRAVDARISLLASQWGLLLAEARSRGPEGFALASESYLSPLPSFVSLAGVA